jgi:dihydrofolate reductase
VVLVAAVARNGVIGLDGALPWRLPDDLAHFRRTTVGHTVVLGRVTYESIGRALPQRTNIVVTRRPGWAAEGVVVAGSVEDAIARAQEYDGDVMVVGGAQVYAAAAPYADAQILTEVHLAPEGDAFYPELDPCDWTETDREAHDGFDIVRYERVRNPAPEGPTPPDPRAAPTGRGAAGAGAAADSLRT